MGSLEQAACPIAFENRRPVMAVKLLLIVYIALLSFHFRIFPLAPGLDPSWMFTLNYVVNSSLLFGKDLVFTYGPLGFLAHPQAIGHNVPVALACHLFAWLLFVTLMAYGALRRLFSLVELLLFTVVVIASRTLMFDYSVTFLVLLLLCFSAARRNGIPYFLAAIFLSCALFFIKISAGLMVVPAILVLSVFDIFRDRKKGLIELGLSLVLLPAMFVAGYLLYNPSVADMLAYLRGIVEISSEYNVAMSNAGQPHEIYLALSVLGAYVYFCILYYRSGDALFPLTVAFLPSLLMGFKHGFVRQDGHVGLFSTTAMFIFGLLLLFSGPKRRVRKSIVTILVIGACLVINFWHKPKPFPVRFLPTEAVKLVFDHSGPKTAGPAGGDLLAEEKLSQDILEKIGRSGVGVFPWEVTYVAANNLIYNPLPVFQAYSAYTAYLDNWNGAHLNGGEAPPWLLMDFADIDDRHCLVDVPATWLSMYRWYEPFQRVGAMLVLKRAESPRFDRLDPAGREGHRITDEIQLPESDEPLLVRVPMDLTFWGKLVKLFYKIRRINMVLTDDAGGAYIYRIVPDTLRNGVFANYLPMNMDELEMLYRSRSPRRIVSLLLFGDDLKLYRKKISVEFLKIPGIRISRVARQQLPADADVPQSPQAALFSIDSVNDRIITQNPITVSMSEAIARITGWAVDPAAGKAAEGIYVYVDGKPFCGIYGAGRPDVAEVYSNPAYTYSGFCCTVLLARLGPGLHSVFFKIFAHDKKNYYRSSTMTLEVLPK
jgi:hypothetical protein